MGGGRGTGETEKARKLLKGKGGAFSERSSSELGFHSLVDNSKDPGDSMCGPKTGSKSISWKCQKCKFLASPQN